MLEYRRAPTRHLPAHELLTGPDEDLALSDEWDELESALAHALRHPGEVIVGYVVLSFIQGFLFGIFSWALRRTWDGDQRPLAALLPICLVATELVSAALPGLSSFAKFRSALSFQFHHYRKL